jgi:hypothetical protein
MAWNLIFYEILHTANFKFIQNFTSAKIFYLNMIQWPLLRYTFVLLILGVQHTLQLQVKLHIILRKKNWPTLAYTEKLFCIVSDNCSTHGSAHKDYVSKSMGIGQRETRLLGKVEHPVVHYLL